MIINKVNTDLVYRWALLNFGEMRKSAWRLAAVLPLVLFLACHILISGTILLSCTGNDKIAGTTSGTETGKSIVAGRITSGNQSPVSGALVELFPTSYDPNSSDWSEYNFPSTTTNNEGYYSIAEVDTGMYNLISFNPDSSKNGVSWALHIEEKDKNEVAEIKIIKPGYISIRIQNSYLIEGGYVYIPGTPFYASSNPTKLLSGDVLLSKVPAQAILPLRYNNKKEEEADVILSDTVAVASQDTLFLLQNNFNKYSVWDHSTRIYINTSATGANIPSDITSFPLLLRLTTSNFDFTQALIDGRDLRFSKANGDPLSYNVDYWKPNEAGIWIGLDTIVGNSLEQYFLMYWGNSNATSESIGRDVFEITNGYEGVWHLQEETNGSLVEVFKDQTIYNRHGTAADTMQNQAPVNAAIGNGVSFSEDKYIDVGDFLNNSGNTAMTFEGWVKTGGYLPGDSIEHYFFSRQGAATGGRGYNFATRVNKLEFNIESDWQTSRVSLLGTTLINDNAWHHVMVTYDGSQKAAGVKMYLDGQPESMNVKMDNFDTGNSLADAPVNIGSRNNGNRSIEGSMDEVRISSVVRNNNWAKLSYESQKSGSKLFIFK